MDKDGPETMREAVARAIFEQEGYCSGAADDPFAKWTWEEAAADEYPVLAAKAYDMADAAIRTVLGRLREPTSAAIQAGVEAYWPLSEFVEGPLTNGERARRGYLAMLDAAVREALPESADSGRG